MIFICVSLPEFKRAIDHTEPFGGVIVSMDDFEKISHAYRIMLQNLIEAVPNVTAERSDLGGFSNGAHTTGVLLAGQDAFLMEHFHSFFFIDGGFGPLSANVLQKTPMKRCRFLMLFGDQPAGENREQVGGVARGLAWLARDQKLDYTSITMRGYGHEMPPEYLELVGRWIRGEKVAGAK